MNSLLAPFKAIESLESAVMTTPLASSQAIVGYVLPDTLDKATAGMSNLGCGINAATGRYLIDYQQQIVNMDSLLECVQISALNTYDGKTVAQESSYSYLSELTFEVGISGGYAGFSGSLNSSFGMTVGQESTNYLATSTELTYLYQLIIPVADRPLILAEGFKNDLYNMDPQQFYTLYGPYFTSKVIVGGRMGCSVQTEASTSLTQTSVAVDAKAAFDNEVTTGAVETEFTYTSTSTGASYVSETGIVMCGGDLAVPALPTGGIDVDGWKKTIADSPAVVGWGELSPMWELVIGDDERKNALKGALDAYFSEPNSYLLAPLTLKVFCKKGKETTGVGRVTVTTDVDYKLLCGGASLVQGGDCNQFLTSSNVIDCDAPNQWTVGAKSVHNSTEAILSAHAIAVYDPTDLLDIKVFSNTSGSGQKPFGSTDISQFGYVMTGGGATTTPSNNDTDGLMLTASYPSSLSTWTGLAKDHSQKCEGTITVSAIGVKWRNPNGKPTLGTEHTLLESPTASSDPSSSVAVGGNANLVGGGAFDKYGNGYGNMLQSSYPGPNPDIEWTASGHDCGQSNNATVTAYAIGLYVLWKSENGGTVRRAFGPGCLTPPEGCYA